MTDQTGTPQAPIITRSYTESPASWSTHYVDPSGFSCELKLCSDSGADLLKKAAAAMQALVNSGCTPAPTAKPATNGHTNGYSQPSNGHTEAPHLDNGQEDPTLCKIHGTAMARHERDGRSWFSHRLDDGSYCKGKAK